MSGREQVRSDLLTVLVSGREQVRSDLLAVLVSGREQVRPDLLAVLHLPDDVRQLHAPQRLLGHCRGLPGPGTGDDRPRGEGTHTEIESNVGFAFSKELLKVDGKRKMTGAGNVTVIQVLSAIEGYLNLNVLFLCKQSISISTCYSFINR